MVSHSSFGHAAAGAVLSHYTDGWSDIGYMLGRYASKDKRANHREDLYDLRSRVKNFPTN